MIHGFPAREFCQSNGWRLTTVVVKQYLNAFDQGSSGQHLRGLKSLSPPRATSSIPPVSTTVEAVSRIAAVPRLGTA